MKEFIHSALVAVAIYFRRYCVEWFHWLALSLLAITGILIMMLVFNVPVDEVGLLQELESNSRSITIHDLFKYFNVIVTIVIAAFSGFAFIYLYQHTKAFFKDQNLKVEEFIHRLKTFSVQRDRISLQLRQLQDYQEKLVEDRRSNIGIALLAFSALFWQIGGVVILLEEVGYLQNEIWSKYISEQISTLNSACLLGILITLQVRSSSLPRWWQYFWIRIFRRYRYIFWITISLSIVHIIILLFSKKYVNNLLAEIPDFAFSLVTITMLYTCLRALFRERNLKRYIPLLTLTVLLTFIAQLKDILELLELVNKNDLWYVLISQINMLLYKVLLLMILFALGYSWRYHIDKKTINMLDDFKGLALDQLAEEVSKQTMAKKQMNHAIRGSLRCLASSVKEYREKSDSCLETIEAITGRVWSIYALHDELHGSKESARAVLLGESLKKITNVLGKAHGYTEEKLVVICEFSDIKILFDYARDINIVITELVINSIKALESTPKDKRYIQIRAFFREENVIVQVTDNGPGYQKEKITRGYGQEVVRKIVEKDLNGIIQKLDVSSGTTIEITIPLLTIKIATDENLST